MVYVVIHEVEYLDEYHDKPYYFKHIQWYKKCISFRNLVDDQLDVKETKQCAYILDLCVIV